MRGFALMVVLGVGCSVGGEEPSRDGGMVERDGADTPDGATIVDGAVARDATVTPSCSPGAVDDCDETDPARTELLRDVDSDQDGLPDLEELCTHSTDPCNRDTDGDGITDLGEVRGTMTDPNDPSSTIPEGDFFVVLPRLGDRALRRGSSSSATG